ncbi:hypothetical protein K488DRAFT_68888 [Vararia minispora EC-137]|uniref:Uncharacterized protein n=1 Tax=Vararia minispora EC-137 TaxID=1314806 RepID=A0ACB8QSW4_9AGAM|nr:hypothetical protein K488DRAFT_68888 [Vararia minispora EC-137]
MQFSSLFSLLIAAAVVVANPTVSNVLEARSADGQVDVLKRSGCGSTGPLGPGHYKWWIVASCTPGAPMTCEATDATGCVPGDPSKIGSLEVDDPNDTTQYAVAQFQSSVGFICPANGQVRCEANFEDNYDGPNYSLRVF